MIFKHTFQDFPNLIREDTEEGRHYVLPSGERYPSVTHILSALDDGKSLEEWIKRVGEEEANKIGRVAANRGTLIHKMVEDYLLNKDNPTKGHMPINVYMFNNMKKYLHNIEEVYGIECSLYSHSLQAAGTADIFAKYKGVRSIVDNKSSKREKREEWIQDYFLQTGSYAIMIEELYDIAVPQVVVLITCENGEVQEFVRPSEPYKEKVRQLFKEYHERLH